MKLSEILLNFSIVIIVVGFLIYVYFLFISQFFFSKKEKPSPERAATFGDFITGLTAPIFTLSGFLIIYATITDQKENNQIQQFESVFFKFLEYHRDNNEKIEIIDPKTCSDIKGRQTWVTFREIVKKADEVLETDSTFAKLTPDQKIDICYEVLYYGLGTSDTTRLYSQLDNYQINHDTKISFFTKLRAVEHCEKVNIYFYGFSNVLGNYFQEYFTYINYVDKSVMIPEQEKYNYINMLISQNDYFCTAVQYFYIHSELAKKNHIDLANKYKILDNVDKRLVRLKKNSSGG